MNHYVSCFTLAMFCVVAGSPADAADKPTGAGSLSNQATIKSVPAANTKLPAVQLPAVQPKESAEPDAANQAVSPLPPKMKPTPAIVPAPSKAPLVTPKPPAAAKTKPTTKHTETAGNTPADTPPGDPPAAASLPPTGRSLPMPNLPLPKATLNSPAPPTARIKTPVGLAKPDTLGGSPVNGNAFNQSDQGIFGSAAQRARDQATQTPHLAPPPSAAKLNRGIGLVGTPLDRAMQDKAAGIREAAEAAALANEAGQAAPELGRVEEAIDPAAGTALGGFGAKVNGGVGMPDFSHLSNAGPSADCIADPSNCIHGADASSRDRFGGPPTAGDDLPDGRGVASDGMSPAQRWNTFSGRHTSSQDFKIGGTRTSTDFFEHGTYTTTWEDHGNGTVERTDNSVLDDGTQVYDNVVTEDGEVVASYHSENDENGNGFWKMEIYGDDGKTISQSSGRVVGGRAEEPPGGAAGGGSDEQPVPHDGATSGKGDNCNWNPVLGRCMTQRASPKDMTSQPGEDGGTGAVTTAGTAGPHIGPEAVTNPGDGSFISGGNRGGSGGRPYDPRDPEGIIPVPGGGPSP